MVLRQVADLHCVIVQQVDQVKNVERFVATGSACITVQKEYSTLEPCREPCRSRLCRTTMLPGLRSSYLIRRYIGWRCFSRIYDYTHMSVLTVCVCL